MSLADKLVERFRPQQAWQGDLPEDYAGWLQQMFPQYVVHGFAPHHQRFWEWIWSLKPGHRVDPLVCIWPRGGGKSSSVEMACAALGARGMRKYILYVSGVQPQADDHVANVAGLLESKNIQDRYPALGKRLVDQYGSSKGWRRNRIRTSSGLTVDALGLEVAARGVKLDEMRPDLIVFDDVDDTEDSIDTVIPKKIRAITQKLLPARSSDGATLFVQNLVHYEGIAARLVGVASEPADFLATREVIGPIPAVVGLTTEPVEGSTQHRITGGEPTWEGQDLNVCQGQIDDWGLEAFLSEAQHGRRKPKGQAFPEFDTSIHVIEPYKIPDHYPRFRAIDYGYAAPHCVLWFAREPSGRLVIYREAYGAGKTATQQAYDVRVLSAGERFAFTVADPSMWASTKEGMRFKSAADQYQEIIGEMRKASNDRIIGWGRLHNLLEWAPNSPPNIVVFKNCHNLIRTLPLMEKDPNRPEDINTDLEDHAPDAMRYGAMAATWFDTRGPLKQRPLVARG